MALSLLVWLASGTAGAAGVTRQLMVHAAPVELPTITLEKGKRQGVRPNDLGSRLVILNFWSPACPESREELASLEALQARFDQGALFVAPVIAGPAQPIGAGPEALASYSLPVDARPRIQLGLLGFPTTLLLNGKGQEIGRVSGAVDWVAPETVRLVALFAAPKGGEAVKPGPQAIPGIAVERDFLTSFECY